MVIAVSRAVAVAVEGTSARVVYTGIEIPPSSPAVSHSSKDFRIGAASRLVPLKGLIYLIRAMARLRNRIPTASLEIAGDGPDLTRLQAEVSRLGLDKHVSFLGWVERVEELFMRWSVFAHPSLEEGLGVAVLEAMAAGLPVVAAASGGVPEVVSDGRTGYLVPAGDDAGLANRIGDLLENRVTRESFGAAGLARAREHFSVVAMAENVFAIYDELLTGSTVGR